jgi:hypothetical protein
MGVLGDRWGVSDAEVARRYPCDDLVPAPAVAAWRGISVDAAPEVVWRWLIQIRLAPYSYDWIDNLGRTSPRQLQGLSDPVVGDRFTAAFGVRVGRVLAVDPGEQLTGEILGAVMSYVLVPDGHGTRLLLKLAMRGGRMVAPLLSLGDLVMARRQLRNFAALAEASAAGR